MSKKTKKQLTHWLSVIVIGIALGLALQFVRAWTEPSQAPPNGNVGAPINTSANPQMKAGSFTSGGNVTANQFCLGGVCISAWPSGGSAPPPSMCTCSSPAALCGGTYDACNACYAYALCTFECQAGAWVLKSYNPNYVGCN